MGSLFSRVFRSPEAYMTVAQSAGSPSVSGTDRLGPADDVNAFALVTEDRLDEARQVVRDMSRQDRALLSLSLDDLSRIVSEEEDFRRMADRRAARLSSEGAGPVSLEDIVEGHRRDI